MAKIWEPKEFDHPSYFLDRLPTIVENKYPLSDHNEIKKYIQKNCPCPGSCHERPYAAWIKGIHFIKPILIDALNYHIEKSQQQPKILSVTSSRNNDNSYSKTSESFQNTIVNNDDLTSVPIGTILPLIPDAAIHYRCGDNFIGHYGFVPFRAFKEKIPPDANTIYVLAEKKTRKTITKPHLQATCNVILNSLFGYLQENFPKATILIRRGDDLYLDMARLAYAKTVVCSVSTFCLWPAIINNGTAHFPRTRLITGGDMVC